MAFVVYDACVLYPAPLRDLLIRLGLIGLVRPRWTDAILDDSRRRKASMSRWNRTVGQLVGFPRVLGKSRERT